MSKQTEKEQLTQQIMELQKEFVSNQQKIKLYDQTLVQQKRNKEKFNITIKEIEKLEESHKTYKSVGRAFFLAPKKQVSEDYQGLLEQNEKEFMEVGRTKMHFDNKHKELEKQLTELIK